MATDQWIILVVVLIGIGALVSLRLMKPRSKDPSLSANHSIPASSLSEQSSQREDQRLAGMSAEDRAWEQATLQRQRDREAHAPSIQWQP